MMRQRVIAMLPRIFVIVAVVVILGAALGAGSVLAAKGGTKGKPEGNDNGHRTATLWTEPAINPYPAHGFDFTVRGSGFNPDSTVHVSFGSTGCCLAFSVGADSDGEIGFSWTTAAPATYTFRAYQDLKGHKWSVYAETHVEVTEQ